MPPTTHALHVCPESDLDREPALARHLRERIAAEPERARAAWGELRERLAGERLLFGVDLIPTSLVPHLVHAEVEADWAARAEALFDAAEYVARAALEDPDLPTRLGLPPGAQELCAIDPGTSRSAVVCRADVVWSAGRMMVLELNADSPAMMTFADRLQLIQQELFPLCEFRGQFRLRDRTAALLAALTGEYRAWGGRHRQPAIAIVDWPGEKTQHELTATAAEFTRLGCESWIAAPHELRLAGGRLLAGGRPVDLVYRRILFGDFVRRADELAPLIDAYRAGAVCMINPLRSILCGTKGTLALLRAAAARPQLPDALRSALRTALPTTLAVDERMRAALVSQKDRWVLKRSIGHGGHQVVIGREVDQATWVGALGRSRRDPWVAQALCPVAVAELPMADDSGRTGVSSSSLRINWNPFVYAGRYAGAISRAGRAGKISITDGGALLPTATV